MKIAFLGFSKIKYLPYMHSYLDQIDKDKNEVHLIYWDRDEAIDDEVPKGVIPHCYKCYMLDSFPMRKKVGPISGYGKYAKKIIREICPDFMFVLHSTTAITIYSLLCGKYKGKYIFDYRDVTYEKHQFYKHLIAKIVSNSVYTFTSSDGFRVYLPEIPEKVLTSHNLLRSSLSKHDKYKGRIKRLDTEPIRIAFWGMIRQREFNEVIINRLGGDKRFELHYYGRVSKLFEDTLRRSQEVYSNIFYHGEYIPSDRDEFADKTDILHNLYSNNDATMPLAMSNKYYDGLIYYLPQLCMKDSYMGDMCEKHCIGLTCDPHKDGFADNVYEYYRNLDLREFEEKCDITLDAILAQVENDETIIRSIVNV